MAYSSVHDLCYDTDFRDRIAACLQVEGLTVPGKQPEQTAAEIAWPVSASPGFGDQYESAVIAGVERPGRDPSVITDAQLLAACTAVTAG